MNSYLAEKVEQPKSCERVKINVGGTIFETTVSTMTRLNDTVLSAMVANRWRNEEELFVDRDPTYFGKVLNYLRDGENFALPIDRDARESLRREAEFYILPGLAKMCSPGWHVGAWVQWKESSIERYWTFHARCEYYGKKICPSSVDCGSCWDCGSGLCLCDGSKSAGPNAKAINYDEWICVKDEMKVMKGYVVKIVPHVCRDGERQNGFCCDVDWDNGWHTHIPQYRLCLARP